MGRVNTPLLSNRAAFFDCGVMRTAQASDNFCFVRSRSLLYQTSWASPPSGGDSSPWTAQGPSFPRKVRLVRVTRRPGLTHTYCQGTFVHDGMDVRPVCEVQGWVWGGLRGGSAGCERT